MATRIHNFSYSGGNGALSIIPCINDEQACKIYIKSIVAKIAINGARLIRGVTLSTKAADNSTPLIRAHWTSRIYGSSTNFATINLAGGCTAVVADWKTADEINGRLTSSEVEGGELWPVFEKVVYSGKGYEQWLPFGWVRHDIPEYFYVKRGDFLFFNGYTGDFHIELMLISES